MKALLMVDETGDFAMGYREVAVAGALVPAHHVWSSDEFIGQIYAQAAPQVGWPLHMQCTCSWVQLAARACGGPAKALPNPPATQNPRTAAALRAAQNGQLTDDAVGCVASEMAWQLQSSPRRIIVAATGATIGKALAPVARADLRNYTAMLREAWADGVPEPWSSAKAQLADRGELDRATATVLANAAMAKPELRTAVEAFRELSLQMGAAISRANRLLFSRDSQLRAVWCAASETEAPRVAQPQPAERWLSAAAALIDRAARVAGKAGYRELEVQILLPKYLAAMARAQNMRPQNLLKDWFAGIAEDRPDVQVAIRLGAIHNNQSVRRNARLILADIAAFETGRALRGSRMWAEVKANLAASGIWTTASQDGQGVPLSLPHLCAQGAAAAWLACPPPRVPPNELGRHKPWAWEQAHAWAKEEP